MSSSRRGASAGAVVVSTHEVEKEECEEVTERIIHAVPAHRNSLDLTLVSIGVRAAERIFLLEPHA